MPEEKFPTLPAEEAFTILEAPLIRLVRGKPVHKFSQASLTPYPTAIGGQWHRRIIRVWSRRSYIGKRIALYYHAKVRVSIVIIILAIQRPWDCDRGKFPCANTQLGPCQSGSWAMWLFHTASFRGQDEYQDTNLWFVAFCSTHLSPVNVRGERNDSWAHIWTVGTSVYDVLEKGFNDLMDLCDVVTEKFTSARDELAAQQQK